MTLKKSNYIHLAIMFILAFGISYLPPFGQVTPFGMKAIGVFVSVLYGWIFFDLFWTSIYGFMIIPILGLNTVTGAFKTLAKIWLRIDTTRLERKAAIIRERPA